MATVKVKHPHQVSHDGRVYRPGEAAEVPLHVATEWIEDGWVVAHDKRRD